MVAFIAGHAHRSSVDGLHWGVEPICRVPTEQGIQIAPSTYYDAAKRARRVRAQDVREERLMLAIARVHHDNFGVYGARKVCLALNREAIPVARLHGRATDGSARVTRRAPRPQGAHHPGRPGSCAPG